METSEGTDGEDNLEHRERPQTSSKSTDGAEENLGASNYRAGKDTNQLRIQLDPWQREVVKAIIDGDNICLRSGRQVGKSTVVAVGTSHYALKNRKKSVMVISATERQAYLLFSKILAYLLDHYKKYVLMGKDRPTKSEIKLSNGTIIRCLPTGMDGIGIRGYTVDKLIADEAAYIPNDVWPAVTPMLATTKGAIVLLSTPKGIGNYFYECYHNPNFKTWHISSEDCPRIPKDFLDFEKRRLSSIHYKQEYQGEFTDQMRQILSDSLIKAHMKLKRSNIREGEFALGIDVARMGGDQCTFEIIRAMENGEFHHVENFITERILIPDTIELAKAFNREYKDIIKMYIDTGGMGVGVFDFLLKDPETYTKVVSIDNATRPVERDGWDKKARKARLMKEQGIMNMRQLLESDKLWLLDDEAVFFSLRAYTWDDEKDKIVGEGTHIAEGLWRACWYSQEKVNKLRFDYM